MSGLDRRAAVTAWRWTEDRTKAPAIEELLERWPEMRDCPHPEVNVRSLRNSYGVVVHMECKDCPKSAMQLVEPEELTWPGEEFWALGQGRPAWADVPRTDA